MRGKKASGSARPTSQPELKPVPASAPPSETPRVIEYQPFPDQAQWRVERFDLLTAEFDLTADGPAESRWKRSMEFFHIALCGHKRQWHIIRRLFGVMPLLPASDATPDDLRCHTREEICAELGISDKDMVAELVAAKAVHGLQSKKAEEKKAPAKLPMGLGEEDESGADILRKIGINEAVFAGDEDTRKWFVEQAKGWKTALDEPMSSTLAAQCLMNGIELRKIRKELSGLSITSENYSSTKRLMEAMEERYEKQMAAVAKMCPWIGQVDGKISFKGTLSELIAGYREYYASGDNRLLDRVRTAGEIEVDHRRSQQAPHIRYRLGQTLYIIEAMHNLHDPNFRSQLDQRKLAKYDQIWRRVAEESADELGEPIPDLRKDGPEGEYDELRKEPNEDPSRKTA